MSVIGNDHYAAKLFRVKAEVIDNQPHYEQVDHLDRSDLAGQVEKRQRLTQLALAL